MAVTFHFSAQHHYRVRCINPACGRHYEAHYPPTHTHCSAACWRSFQPTSEELAAWLAVAAKSREKGKAA